MPTWAARARCTSRSPMNSVCTFPLWSVKKSRMHRLFDVQELLLVATVTEKTRALGTG